MDKDYEAEVQALIDSGYTPESAERVVLKRFKAAAAPKKAKKPATKKTATKK